MTFTADSPEVVEFVAAYQENRNLAASRDRNGYRIVTKDRRKYILVDEVPTFDGADQLGRSGRFMIDKASGSVFTIAGYGKRNHRIGTVEQLAEEYRAGSATYRPEAGAYVETGYSRVASWGRR